MNIKILEYLRCPECLSEVYLKDNPEGKTEIIEDELSCHKCNKTYEIKQGVPIMTSSLEKDMKKVQKTFSKEWKLHKYGETKTWGLTQEERKAYFLKQMGVEKSDLKDKTLFDAGCGNGELTLKLQDYGFKYIIGMDLSNSVFEAYEHNTNKENIFFVQGDIMKPPFENKSFDYIYSDGVIHHTPNAKFSFSKLADLTKGRLWVWVYLNLDIINDNPVKLKTFNFLKNIVNKCPVFVQTTIIYAFALPLATCLEYVGLLRKRGNWREKVILIRDGFTPLYDSRHTFNEVEGWFKENKFSNIILSDTRQTAGFGMYGDKL